MMSDASTQVPAAAGLLELPQRLVALADFKRVATALASGETASLSGVWGSACALVSAALALEATETLVVVCPKPGEIDELLDELELFTDASVEPFPAWEAESSERLLHDETHASRLRTLKLLLGPSRPKIVVTSIESLLQPVPSTSTMSERTRQLCVGETLETDAFLKWLASNGFSSTSAVELPGEFSYRGGILDVFAPDWTQPVRLELFGDDVESIRRFDVETQRSLESLDEIEITVLGVRDTGNNHLSDYLAPDSWFLLFDPDLIQQEGTKYLQRLDDPSEYHSVATVMKEVSQFGSTTAGQMEGTDETSCHLPFESVERFSGDISKVKVELDNVTQGQEVSIVCITDAEALRLKEIFLTTQPSIDGRLHFYTGHLRNGFRVTSENRVLLSGTELFNRTELRRTAHRHLGKAIDNFLDLREGDLVVHLSHGIGRYRGMELIDKQGQVEEHLTIEFRGRTKIYVPTAKIDLVQKYIGGRKSRPTLATIGGQTWVKQKKAAERAVQDMACEMLELQAARQYRPGISFAADTQWQSEFDASFPYQETPDQLAAMTDIKGDMQQARPMDRLLCGDVGFGKTEMAIRAAFKAVDNGYQVAILVPTTLLAEQHFRTFCERISEFPFVIAKLSRFCTNAEQRHTVKGLKEGSIDIVIGTHRLASKDVDFMNLGLVVIDEEQRFGVEVKERLKSLRSTVDVLTLSATPIPRTLHMSLVGVRDISNLLTSPEDRFAVETKVTRFKNETIRHAIMRELNRGGQIYFVHNRVNDIQRVADKIQKIVPEATVGIGHGQMPEGELEKVMLDFVDHRFDVLIATTIVESGLDIPNANTMFIDQAEIYGLADLHQLRGRVGRYKHRAYCYMLLDPLKHLSPTAARRLRAIEEFSDLGAGFGIAMRDLEIRGAGNLLGTQQSGHIASVGYELYCQLLEKAVRAIQKLPPRLSMDVTIDLPGEAFLPPDYVDDMRLKIDLYRRLTRITTENDLDEFRRELVDRFGSPPEPVERMLALASLRIDAAVWQVESIKLEEGRYLAFGYKDRGRITQLSNLMGKKLRVVDDQSAYLTLKKGITNPDWFIKAAKMVLRPKI